MKILFLADVTPTPNSGAAGTELQTIAELKRLGCKVDEVWADDLPHRIQHGNLHYLLELPMAYKKVVKQKFRDNDYDVIHANQPHGYLAARYASECLSQAVFVHRSHGFEPRAKRELGKWRERFDEGESRSYSRALASDVLAKLLDYNNTSIARWADGHIVSASECRDFLANEHKVPADRIAVIPQAAPDRYVSSQAADLDGERLRNVLYVGQYAFFKAPMVVAGVLNRLVDADVNLRFTWVCSAQHHGAAGELLSERARPRVEFLPWLSQEELMKVYDAHGIFLFPSFFEGFGKAFMEAMARGLCVVAADNGGMRDVIVHGVNGLKCETGDLAALANACLELLRNPRKAKSISRNAVATAHSHTWAKVADETLNFYHHLARRKRAAHS
jgi:glycosyltransferase involved in cell wall biosynthesis